MTEFEFYKMSASGNDFIILDNRDGKLSTRFPDIKEFVVKICRRNHSVGADGVILIEKDASADFAWKFYNSDGSEAEMCGNGGRCAARFAYERGIAKAKMTFRTGAGLIKAEVSGHSVKLQLTSPTDLKLDYPVRLEDNEIFLSSVNTGVPHAIVIVDDVERVAVEELGRLIRYHKAFGEKGSNVDFVQIVDKKTAKLRTYERGVEGETLACGTGAAASGVILKQKGLAKSPVNIETKGGETLKIYVDEEVYLEGNAKIIFVGRIHEDALS